MSYVTHPNIFVRLGKLASGDECVGVADFGNCRWPSRANGLRVCIRYRWNPPAKSPPRLAHVSTAGQPLAFSLSSWVARDPRIRHHLPRKGEGLARRRARVFEFKGTLRSVEFRDVNLLTFRLAPIEYSRIVTGAAPDRRDVQMLV